MMPRCLAVLILLASTAVALDPAEELEFARRLGRRGMKAMAVQVLDNLIATRTAEGQRYGRYGKALLVKDEASLTRARFERALDQGRTPRVKRDDIINLFKSAQPELQDFASKNAGDADARFLLAELLMEYAEFLVGSGYPDGMADDVAGFVSEHSDAAKKLFEDAISHFGTVKKAMDKRVGDDEDLANPDYRRASLAGYQKAKARLRMALMYPKGSNFIYFSEQALEELDDFASEHYDDAFGAWARLDLGRCHFERALRLGEKDDAENAINYFQILIETLDEDPTAPEIGVALAQAFYWHAKACNAMARADGSLKKPNPVMFDNSIRTLQTLRTKVKLGANQLWALRAKLEIGESYAGSNRFTQAVSLAGQVLSKARVEGHNIVMKSATERLTAWVASVSSSGLDAQLLFEVGESLAAQGRTSSAVTFYQKAVAASNTDDLMQTVAYPARARMARAYRIDKRYFVSAAVAWDLVDEYLKSGSDEESEFGQHASDACNTARLAWKSIAAATKRAGDDSRYSEVKRVFRDKFPGHPENSDAAFSAVREDYSNGKYEQVAKDAAEIAETSKSYWRAQRLIPVCYWKLASAADRDKKEAAAKKWWTQTLASSDALIARAQAKSSEKESGKSLQRGMLVKPIALSALKRWDEALTAVNAYFAKFPDQFLQRGLELKIKIEALIELKKYADAEATLGEFRRKLPASSHLSPTMLKVVQAMQTHYRDVGGDEGVKIASRAADILSEWMKKREDVQYGRLYYFGEMLKDAHRWNEASIAYDDARALATNPAVKATLTLKAAEMGYKALLADTKLTKAQKAPKIAQARKLFLDVILPNKADQSVLLKKLSKGWLKKEEWAKVKRNPSALYTTAELLSQSAPAGIDGRAVATRLLAHLQTFTNPIKDPNNPNPKTDPYVNLWWDAAELQLTLYKEIAEANPRGEKGKSAATRGASAASKWIFQYQKMDGEGRVNRIKALQSTLKRLAGG